MAKYTMKVEYAQVGNMTMGLGPVSMLFGLLVALSQGATKVIVSKESNTRNPFLDVHEKYKPTGAF